jgi:hypothetical protein
MRFPLVRFATFALLTVELVSLGCSRRTSSLSLPRA